MQKTTAPSNMQDTLTLQYITVHIEDLRTKRLFLPNVPLPDQHPGMVDTLGQPQLEHLCLQASLEEVLKFQTQHVIELHPHFVQHTYTHQSS